jgi:hypothetical protein
LFLERLRALPPKALQIPRVRFAPSYPAPAPAPSQSCTHNLSLAAGYRVHGLCRYDAHVLWALRKSAHECLPDDGQVIYLRLFPWVRKMGLIGSLYGQYVKPTKIFIDREEKEFLFQRDIAPFLRALGYAHSTSEINRLCSPAVNKGPLIAFWHGCRPLRTPMT